MSVYEDIMTGLNEAVTLKQIQEIFKGIPLQRVFDIAEAERNGNNTKWVHAVWKDDPDDYGYWCTHCGVWEISDTNFCPHCGAKMDGANG